MARINEYPFGSTYSAYELHLPERNHQITGAEAYSHLPGRSLVASHATGSIDILWCVPSTDEFPGRTQRLSIFDGVGNRVTTILPSKPDEAISAYAPSPTLARAYFSKIDRVCSPGTFNGRRHKICAQRAPLIVVVDHNFRLPCKMTEEQAAIFFGTYNACAFVVTDAGRDNVQADIIDYDSAAERVYPDSICVFVKGDDAQTISLALLGSSCSLQRAMTLRCCETYITFDNPVEICDYSSKHEERDKVVTGSTYMRVPANVSVIRIVSSPNMTCTIVHGDHDRIDLISRQKITKEQPKWARVSEAAMVINANPSIVVEDTPYSSMIGEVFKHACDGNKLCEAAVVKLSSMMSLACSEKKHNFVRNMSTTV